MHLDLDRTRAGRAVDDPGAPRAGRNARVAGGTQRPHATPPERADLPTLLRMAWPNILVMLAQASTGLIETWWVSRLGSSALAGMALVFPGFMMMQMLSGGAMGGGISSAIARALGGRPARRRRRAGTARDHHQRRARPALFRPGPAFGPTLYRALGGEGDSLEAALQLLERGVRRHRAGLADERPGQRDPRHRQHARPLAGDLPRRRAADPALAAA